MKSILTFSFVLISTMIFSQLSYHPDNKDFEKRILLETSIVNSNNESPINLSDKRDGESYKTVEINSQNWMTENLNFETTNSYCYEYLEENCDKYGRLYTWEDAQNVCPDGWRLPTDEEWTLFTESLGAKEYTATKFMLLKRDIEKSVLGGWRTNNGNFYNLEENGYYWTSTENVDKFAWYRYIFYNQTELMRNYHKKEMAFSVRCIKE